MARGSGDASRAAPGGSTGAGTLDEPIADDELEQLVERGRALLFLPGPLRDGGATPLAGPVPGS